MRISLIAAACIALPLLGACSSEDAQADVTQADLSQTLQKSLQNPELADCAAKIYIDEGISQDGLRRMTDPSGSDASGSDGSMGGLSDDDAKKARSAAEKIATECVAKPQQ